MATFTHYEILGVTPDADAAAIKAAYRVASKAVHPDASGASAALFAQVTEAYRVLSDPSARRRYDAALNPSYPPPTPRADPWPARYTGPPPSAAPRTDPQPAPSPVGRSWWWKAGVGFVGMGIVIAAATALVTHGWARAGYGAAVVVLAAALAVVLSPVLRPTGSGRLAAAARRRWVRMLAWAVALAGSAVAWAPVLVVLAVVAVVIVLLALGFILAVSGD